MFSKQDFLDSVAHEIHVSKHLYSKLSSTQLEYRPGQNMRNTLELLRYLTFCGVGPVEALVRDDWTVIGKYQEAASQLAAEEFPQRMDDQLAAIRQFIGSCAENDLKREVSVPWGAKIVLGKSLVDLPLKFLASYRLQLFAYAKASGASELTTYDAWLGMDTPAKGE